MPEAPKKPPANARTAEDFRDLPPPPPATFPEGQKHPIKRIRRPRPQQIRKGLRINQTGITPRPFRRNFATPARAATSTTALTTRVTTITRTVPTTTTTPKIAQENPKPANIRQPIASQTEPRPSRKIEPALTNTSMELGKEKVRRFLSTFCRTAFVLESKQSFPRML